jgi:hypothetical protein
MFNMDDNDRFFYSINKRSDAFDRSNISYTDYVAPERQTNQ